MSGDTYSDPDFDLACGIYQQLAAGPEEWMQYTVIPGPPANKQRPRFGKGGRVYTPTESRQAEERTALHLSRVCPTPHTGNVALGCVFFRPNRQRIDADNMMKHVCDAANGVVWIDDSQVTTILGRVELDAENPRTIIVIGPDESTMMRGTDAWYPCPICEARIQMDGQTKLRKTCSASCAAKARGFNLLTDLIPCGHCGQPFKRVTKYQRICSPECRVASFRGKHQAAAAPFSRCGDCGQELAHRRGGRCRDCWRLYVASARVP